jgi:hypothetical protein
MYLKKDYLYQNWMPIEVTFYARWSWMNPHLVNHFDIIASVDKFVCTIDTWCSLFFQGVAGGKYRSFNLDYLYQNWMPIEVKIWYQNGWPNSDSLSFITYRIFKRKLKDRYLPPATPWQNLKKKTTSCINGADKFVNGSYDISVNILQIK